MSQDSKVLSRAFLGIGLILLVISAIIFYYHFTFTKSAVHTEGIIVDAVWYNNHSNDVDDNGSWYPVVAFRPTPDYTLIFNSNKWGFVGIAGIIFGSVGLIITLPSTKKSRRKRKSRP